MPIDTTISKPKYKVNEQLLPLKTNENENQLLPLQETKPTSVGPNTLETEKNMFETDIYGHYHIFLSLIFAAMNKFHCEENCISLVTNKEKCFPNMDKS